MTSPRPGGIPENLIFCQSCGSDIDLLCENKSYCECGDKAILSNWVADSAGILHLFQGLNNMIIDDKYTAQSSINCNIFYEL